MSVGLLDYFAAKAAQALLTGHASVSEDDAKCIAEQSFRVARAMVAASRSGSQKKYACEYCRDTTRPVLHNGVPIACPHCFKTPDLEATP